MEARRRQRQRPRKPVNIQTYQFLSKWALAPRHKYNNNSELQSLMRILSIGLRNPSTQKLSLKLIQNTLNRVRSKTKEYLKRNKSAISRQLYNNNNNNYNTNNNNYNGRY